VKFLKPATRFGLLLLILLSNLVLAKIHAKYVGSYDLSSSSRLGWIVAYSLMCYSVAYAFGLPDQRLWSSRIRASLAAAITSTLLISFVQVIIGQIFLPRFVLALSLPTLFITFNFVSFVSSILNRSSAQSERVLLVSSTVDAGLITKDIAFHTEIPCVITKHLSTDSSRSISDFSQIISSNNITLVVLGNEALTDPNIVLAVTAAHSQGVRVRTQMAFYNDWLGKVPVRELGEAALLFDVREIHQVGYSRISRLLDVCIAGAGFLVLLVISPLILIGDLVGNRGPILFAQERIGKGQSVFRIYKFRSMVPGDSVGEWTKKDDARITRFGKFLRLSHLDELPQVINILRGDLSIVGPRPEQPHYVSQLAQSIPYYQSRHLVRPGLTGWAQVNYPYGADEIDAFEKLQYEFWYLQHQSMWLDLRIIARTFRHVLGFKGR
jgi:lipopolysaccharide/colanic/teichoic acid biosynthesis glycosyltransferase